MENVTILLAAIVSLLGRLKSGEFEIQKGDGLNQNIDWFTKIF
jgi:hypothetical protein